MEKLVLKRKKRNLDTGSENTRIDPMSKMKLDEVANETGLTRVETLAKMIAFAYRNTEYEELD